MTTTVSFIAQVDNDLDKDQCRYVLATLDAGFLANAVRSLEAIQVHGNLHGLQAMLFSNGIHAAHFVDAHFPTDDEAEIPDGSAHPLSGQERSFFDTEGWSPVPDSTVSSVEKDYAGFLDNVSDVRLLVSSLGLQITASWSDHALVRSWMVPWDILDSARPTVA